MITVTKVNQSFMRLSGEPGELMEIKDNYSFFVPGYKFNPKYKYGRWDGKIHLLNLSTKQMYIGLIHDLKKFCTQNNIKLDIQFDYSDAKFSLEEAQEFIDLLNVKYTPRDYQLDAFVQAIRKKRIFLISPTSSGKSLIMYLILMFLYNKKTLIIVPTVNLVHQLYADYCNYDLDNCIEHEMYKIADGANKHNISQRIVISTWQSLVKLGKEWFDQFDLVMVDEAHGAKATELKNIMEKSDAEYRVALTGTTDGIPTHEYVLEGLFGPFHKVTTLNEMIEREEATPLKVKVLKLIYSQRIKQAARDSLKKKYIKEKDFVLAFKRRNKFIKNLATSLNGNILVLFERRDHGNELYKLIKEKYDKNVYLVHGNISGTKREEIRQLAKTHKECIIVASYGTYSTGIDIPNLNHLILASPTKAVIRLLQSFGRLLRLHETKSEVTVYDIVDDLSIGAYKNYFLKHYIERAKIYLSSGFPFKEYSVKIEDKTSNDKNSTSKTNKQRRDSRKTKQGKKSSSLS